MFAVKVLHDEPELYGPNTATEGWVGAQIQHPGVVTIQTCDRLPPPDNRFYIIMEYLSGKTLRQYLDEYTFVSIKIALYIAHQVARALAEIHRRGFVHRDIKPSNIVLTEATDGEFIFSPKIVDLGLAQKLGRPGESTESSGTTRFRLVGTAKYAAPEQWKYRFVNDRADVYSLGARCYKH